jgi:alpha-tubulin suppressor-like RCC1 family protein
MPTFYNYTEGGQTIALDDAFVSADAFRQGTLFTWGKNAYGQLGINDSGGFAARTTPVTTFAGGTNWKQISSESTYTAAIKTDGTLWTWGSNSNGKLGINDTTQRNTAVTTFAGGTNWKQVSCGYGCAGAIKTDGTLWTWGQNSSGQLGINNTTNRLTPVTTFAGGTNWKQVNCGYRSTTAIKTDGTLWVWGDNTNAQLGTNDTTQRNTPVTTFAGGTNWKQVSSGSTYTAAIKTDGTLWTWGRNAFGQLGINNIDTRTTPVTTFAGGTNWKQVACATYHTLAIKTDGTLWGWGQNGVGSLGINNETNRSTPVTTFAGGTNWKQVDCGGEHQSAAVKTDGTLWLWGRNISLQLGTNDAINRCIPVTTFAGGTNWKQVTTGYFHSVAITYIDDYQ